MLHMSRKMQNPTHAQALVTLRTGRELPDLLQDLYVVQRLSAIAIAAELGVSRNTVGMWLREFAITRPEAVA
jgi:transposase